MRSGRCGPDGDGEAATDVADAAFAPPEVAANATPAPEPSAATATPARITGRGERLPPLPGLAGSAGPRDSAIGTQLPPVRPGARSLGACHADARSRGARQHGAAPN